ncbi:MAG: hypothetical protein KBC21_01590 [Candidatus Pacebacteria bacterium]|nr:hypothetical protein [Candidatus Paceibacterota bacterium]
MNKKFAIIFVVTFIVFFLFNGYFDFASYGLDKVYLTISTFLFSVFNGFFISRQSTRYSDIRNNLSRFDADMTIVYRESSHLEKEEQEHVGNIIREHYEILLKKKDWAYYFTHKSNLIAGLHAYVQVCGDINMDKVRGECLRKMMTVLDDAQIVRKLLVSLKEETIPKLQQVLIYVLAVILFLAVLTLPSKDMVFAALLKAVYMMTTIMVVILLKKFDDLSLFEGTIGEHSAKDVIKIIDGEK